MEKQLLVHIDADLHRELKLIAARTGITLKQIVTLALQQYVGMEPPSLKEFAQEQ